MRYRFVLESVLLRGIFKAQALSTVILGNEACCEEKTALHFLKYNPPDTYPKNKFWQNRGEKIKKLFILSRV